MQSKDPKLLCLILVSPEKESMPLSCFSITQFLQRNKTVTPKKIRLKIKNSFITIYIYWVCSRGPAHSTTLRIEPGTKSLLLWGFYILMGEADTQQGSSNEVCWVLTEEAQETLRPGCRSPGRWWGWNTVPRRALCRHVVAQTWSIGKINQKKKEGA